MKRYVTLEQEEYDDLQNLLTALKANSESYIKDLPYGGFVYYVFKKEIIDHVLLSELKFYKKAFEENAKKKKWYKLF